MTRFKTFLIFFFLILAFSEVYAISPALGASVAVSAAAARRRQEEEHRHELQYHTGAMISFIQESEVWSWKKPYTIFIYENEYFYYQKDPDKCIQYVTKNLKEKRLATEQETYEHDLHLKYFAIAIVTLIVLFIDVIIGSLVYDKIKGKLRQNDSEWN